MPASARQFDKRAARASSSVILKPSGKSESARTGTAAGIVLAAYRLIAEKGFEGLRTRDVATNIGINSATLHYHFATKEALIHAVVQYLMEELSKSRVELHANSTAPDRLLAEFADMKRRVRDSPEQLLVLTELSVRAMRDSAVSNLLRHLDHGWHAQLRSIFQQGLEENTFCADLDPDAAATALQMQLRGLGLLAHAGKPVIERALDEIASATWFAIGAAKKQVQNSRRSKSVSVRG